jgi:hypothetical protein
MVTLPPSDRSPARPSPTFRHQSASNQVSSSPVKGQYPAVANGNENDVALARAPADNSTPRTSRPPPHVAVTNDAEETVWGSNFWVTLVDPQVTDHNFGFCHVAYTSHCRPRHLFLHVLQRVK